MTSNRVLLWSREETVDIKITQDGPGKASALIAHVSGFLSFNIDNHGLIYDQNTYTAVNATVPFSGIPVDGKHPKAVARLNIA